jgi:hypothetical protein
LAFAREGERAMEDGYFEWEIYLKGLKCFGIMMELR